MEVISSKPKLNFLPYLVGKEQQLFHLSQEVGLQSQQWAFLMNAAQVIQPKNRKDASLYRVHQVNF